MAIDLPMGYYSRQLAQAMKKYCVMILPWGKYYYNVLPMGLKISADVFQQELGNLFADCEFVLVYIDDLLVITKGTFKDHLEKVKIALNKLQDAGMQMHP